MTVDPIALERAGYPPIGPDLGEVAISPKARATIQLHAERSYPEEACGFLVGPAPGGTENPRQIDEAIPSENERDGNRTHRFLIPYQEVVRIERLLAWGGKAILGYYHSHPDHLAAPSAYDRDHAWPWYVYVVASVEQGHMTELNAYELDPEGGMFHSLSQEEGTASHSTHQGAARP